MKFEDVKVGTHLRDQKGNVWEVVDAPNLTGIPTFYARCIKFQHPVGVMPQYTVDTEEKARVGRHLWCNKEHLIVAPDSVVKQFKGYLSSADTIKVVTGLNKTAVLRFVTQEQYDNVEVTLESLELIPEPQHLTRDNIRVGMNVRTASGMPCFVFAYTECFVHLKTNLQSLDSEGVLKQVTADLLVNWHDSKLPHPSNVLTTKDFILIDRPMNS